MTAPVDHEVTAPPPAGTGPARKAAIVVGVFLVALVALFAFAPDDDDEGGVSALLRQRAPEVSGVAIDGRTFDIDDHRGSWVLVNFFATWCPGCVNEHPDLVDLERWGAENGQLTLVSVVFNDPVPAVDAFFEQRGGTWPVLNSPEVPVEFQVVQIPETFLVSPAGQVVMHIEGEVRATEIVRFIEAAA
ncbi:MAG: TlpA disulfide reductase family protein [Actinomycetota bacterium]